MTDYTKLVEALRTTERICRDRMDGQVMLDAAAAIEALQSEVDKYKRCEEWVSEDSAFGYGGNVICEDCLQEANGDLDLLYAATKDECEDFELPVLFRTFFTDDEIKEILMRELKSCHEQIPRDTKAFVRRYANEIADEIVKEGSNA